jgi:diguanylate cyclase (GGDEF)-like protein
LRATAWLYVINAVFFLVRGIFAVKDHGPLNDLWDTGLTAITLLFWLSMSVALTLCMILMTGERLQEDLDEQASRDPLTGAFNRRAFAQMAKKEVALAKRLGLPLSVLMMDLDHFKQINDRLGHPGGDAILCRFVAVASRELRGEDLFSRFGGEEFIALLPGSTAIQAIAAAERLRTAFSVEAADALPSGQKLPFPVTVSTGVAQLRDGEDLESAIWRADAALYRAKGLGRNRSELADELPEPAA